MWTTVVLPCAPQTDTVSSKTANYSIFLKFNVNIKKKNCSFGPSIKVNYAKMICSMQLHVNVNMVSYMYAFVIECLSLSLRLRERRDTEDDQVGYTARLTDDHHNFALVHWTGYPSEALFILTRKRSRSSGYTLSEESWLWRLVNVKWCDIISYLFSVVPLPPADL